MKDKDNMSKCPLISPTRRTAVDTTPIARKNYAIQPKPPNKKINQLIDNQETYNSPRKKNIIVKQDDNGAVKKKSNIVFQSKPSLLQLIDSGEVRIEYLCNLMI